MPFTLGVLRPVIVLPEKVLAFSDQELVESIVAHELAHVKRTDDLWLAAQHLAQALFFFHPIVWLTTRAMTVERELACDRLVLASGTLSPKRYGQALLRVLGFDLTSTAAVAAVGTPRRLTLRIQQIATTRIAARPRALVTFVFVALLGWAMLPMTATGYAHLARLSVKAGDGLSDGDEIGTAGSTGVSSGPHLHFEIWQDGEKVDPARIGEVVGGC